MNFRFVLLIPEQNAINYNKKYCRFKIDVYCKILIIYARSFQEFNEEWGNKKIYIQKRHHIMN